MSDQQPISGMAAAAERMPASVAYDNHVVPLRMLAGTLIVAAAAPLKPDALERLRYILNCRIREIIRSPEFITARQTELYSDQPESDDADVGVTWYWPNWHWYEGDQLNIKCSGWENATHWNGCQEFPPDHPDYGMWRWIISIPQYHRLLDEKEIPHIRRIWNRYIARCGRESLLAHDANPER